MNSLWKEGKTGFEVDKQLNHRFEYFQKVPRNVCRNFRLRPVSGTVHGDFVSFKVKDVLWVDKIHLF